MTDDVKPNLSQTINDIVLAHVIAPYPAEEGPSESTKAEALAATNEILDALDEAGYVKKAQTTATRADGESTQDFQDRAKAADEDGNVPAAPDAA